MRPFPRSSLGTASLFVLMLATVRCSSSNVIGPSNQLQVTNVADNFQLQVSNLSNVTQTLTYSWTNTGDSTSINQSSTLTGGSAALSVRAPSGALMYQSDLTGNGTFHSLKGALGAWQIQLVLTGTSGTINFRVQKAP